MKRTACIILASLALFACKGPDNIVLSPDYADIAVPCNIAPLNFRVAERGRVCVTVEGKDNVYRYSSGRGTARFGIGKWHRMLEAETGNTLKVTVTAGKASRSFCWTVIPDKIDRYLSYRLIEPAYEVWNMLSINERDLESFSERKLADNNITSYACMNCHTSNRAADPTTFLHVRGAKGGTVYRHGSIIRKLNTATDSTAGAAVYGEISQSGRYGIFTTADIRPILRGGRMERLEVFDASSDLILLDFEENTVSDSPLVKGSEFQETFPCFSADGSTVYFCRADFKDQPDSTRSMHYDLYSIPFDESKGQLGNSIVKVVDAAALGKSISFPKCSPDGRFILLSVSDYGTFPIWHTETDLWLYDTVTGSIDTLAEVNGAFSDSYHCWSSNGRWIVWASKRDDRAYGRPYFAYVSPDGKVSKPFVMPQKDPDHYNMMLKSYNIPELYNDREAYDAHDISNLYFRMETENMTYKK